MRLEIKSTALLVPAYQIAIQDKWQLQSFWMARELFEAHILAEEWETAIGIFKITYWFSIRPQKWDGLSSMRFNSR